MGHGVEVIDTAWGHVEREQFAPIIDRPMKLKAVKSAHRYFVPLGDFFEHPMAIDSAADVIRTPGRRCWRSWSMIWTLSG